MKRIVLIEDEQDYCDVFVGLHRACSKAFHNEVEILCFHAWREGKTAVDELKPCAVVLDLKLPDSTLDQTITHIADVAANWPPIIVITAEERPQTVEAARQRCILFGARDFILKHDLNRDPTQACARIYHAFLNAFRDKKGAPSEQAA